MAHQINTPLRVISLFSGAGGFDVGLERAGMVTVAQVEWNKHCQSVLRKHWPHVPKWSDISDVHGADLPAADVVAFGSPCQDLSTAGKRAGMVAGETRSGLFYEAIRIIEELQDAGKPPAFVIWENVAGAITSNRGRDFGAVIDSLGKLGALDIQWRLLDAQYFGVPQRRRRVFVVACFNPRIAGGEQILPFGASMCRNTAAISAKRKETARSIEDGIGTNSGITNTGTISSQDNTQQDNDQQLPISLPTVCGALYPGPHPGGATEQDAHSGLLIPFVKSRRAKSNTDFETWVDGEVAPTMNMSDNTSEAWATVLAFGWQENQMAGQVYTDTIPAITTTKTFAIQQENLAVRRLTPRECERLQGWADDHTRWSDTGKEIADGPRYGMIGNGVASPVAEWVGKCIIAATQKAP